MSLTLDRTLMLFERRMAQRVDSRGLVIWLAPIRKVFEELCAAKAELAAQRESERRAAYGQIMLAESELRQLASELADSPANSRPARATRIDTALSRLAAAKGVLSALVLFGLLYATFDHLVDQPRRRVRSRPPVVRVVRAKEDAAA